MAPWFAPAHRGGEGPPLVCLHGFMDSWRAWELVLPALERRHDVLALTLPGHAGGPRLDPAAGIDGVLDEIERALDEAGFATAHLVGNSLGGFLALRLAQRGRAISVVAIAPAGGWEDEDFFRPLGERQAQAHQACRELAPSADAFVATPSGRRAASETTTVAYEHIPTELLANAIRAAAACDAPALIELARREGYELDAERVTCPVGILWGVQDRLLPMPHAAVRYRRDWLPTADWVELDGVGHAPQLDVPLETAQLILEFTSRWSAASE